uniref:NADH:ubiquinone oxidoreductase complex assembly factor 8 n=1 Tax=Sinocyclocheilus rhinocerous TaxID=307959 RepID=A0A673KMT6_9TELE
MSSSNVWTRSRARMRLIPELLAQCSGEAAAYGKCVASTNTEFEVLKSCFQSAAKKGVK